MTRTARVGLDALLTPEESILVLIDHQPFQRMHLWVVRVGDRRSAVSHGAVTEQVVALYNLIAGLGHQ